MATQTTNYNMTKPEGNDFYNIEDFNINFDIIDTELKNTQVNLDKKVDKVNGKGLSTEDYTTAEKTKLAGVAENANNYVHPTSGVTGGTYRSVTVNEQGHVTGGSNPTLPISSGGTGATSASAALTNLGISITATDINNTLRKGSMGSSGNFDTLLTAGCYRIETGWSNKPSGASDYGVVFVSAGSAGDTAWQLYTSYGNGSMWTRSYASGTWTSWIKITGTSDTPASADLAGINGTVRFIARDNMTALADANFGYPYVTSVSTTNAATLGLPSGWFHIMYFRHFDNNGFGAQLAIGLNAGNVMYYRTSAGTTWSGWANLTPPIYSTADITAGSTALASGQMYLVYE